MFVPNFKILGRVVPEKSLTERSLHSDKHCYGKDNKNYIPLYTSNAGVGGGGGGGVGGGGNMFNIFSFS